MQTAEKITLTFFLKLAVLSFLLVLGVFLKPMGVSKPTGAGKITEYAIPVSSKGNSQDTLQIEQPIFKLVKHRLASNSSI